MPLLFFILDSRSKATLEESVQDFRVFQLLMVEVNEDRSIDVGG